MHKISKPNVAIVGAGILGIASARAMAEKGAKVTVFERNRQVQGSSIRNFGMVWPVGQPAGQYLEWAMRSREIWLNIAKNHGVWHHESGSLLALRTPLEMELAEEFIRTQYREGLEIISANNAITLSPILKKDGLLGAIKSNTELIVESRQIMRQLPDVLSQDYGIKFHFNTVVKEVDSGYLITNHNKKLFYDLIIICNGYEFQLLFPDFFENGPITQSFLQMLRSESIHDKTLPLCAGLTFLHYNSYSELPSLERYKKWALEHYPVQINNGIHLLVSQNHELELTIGDSHTYNDEHEPFNFEFIDEAIVHYLNEFIHIPDFKIKQRWNGTYSKLTNGKSHWFEEVKNSVFILNGPGGAGMTLSFGMAENLLLKI